MPRLSGEMALAARSVGSRRTMSLPGDEDCMLARAMLDLEEEALVQELLRSDPRRGQAGMLVDGGGLDGSDSPAAAGVGATADVLGDDGDPARSPLFPRPVSSFPFSGIASVRLKELYRISLSEGAVSVADPPPSSTPPDAVSSADGAAGASNEGDSNGGGAEPARSGRFDSLVQSAKNFFLPSGYPGSLTSDYTSYMLWQFPVHITGWASSTLVTSTLLQAVGVGSLVKATATAAAGTAAASGAAAATGAAAGAAAAGAAGTVAAGAATLATTAAAAAAALPAVDPASAAAATAAIKWVAKDGIGAVGRLLVGGRFGSIFDEDPKQWRFVADLIGSSGAIFELATPLAPTHFLLLASLGNLTKAVAKGLKDPSARVIQTHFALQANVGEVVAKEEVYKVMAQLVGLGCGVLLLSSPYIAESYWSLVTTWAVIRSTHLAFRFKSLSVLEFDSLNFKRMAILARAHVSGATELPSVQAVNQKERLWLPRRLTSPRINLGCSLADLSVLLEQQSANRMPITELLALYRDEQHVLLMDDTGAFSVIFKQGASKGTVLRVVWQACWLQQQRRERRREHGADGEEVHSDLADRSGGSRSGGVGNSSSSSGGIGILQESLNALGSEFEGFLGKASAAGWDTNTLVAKVPPSAPLLMLEYEGFLAQETAAGWDTNTLLAKVPSSAPLLML
ncbi:unnamed protein product [Closterium sp. Naga37s-1]|nr:unnamed protein product [Closterium sp. Naga37s-1]